MNPKKLSRKNKAVKLFAMFVLSKIRKDNHAKLMNQIYKRDLTYDSILINEADKPIFGVVKGKKKSSKAIDADEENDSSVRNVDLIFISLLNFTGFQKYIKFQELTKDDIMKTAMYIKHKFFRKGTYIFRKHDRPNALYGVIKGKVSLRENPFVDKTRTIVMLLNENQKSQFEENTSNDYKYQDRDSFNQPHQEYSVSNFVSRDSDDEEYKEKKNFEKQNEEMTGEKLSAFIDGFEREIVKLGDGMCFGEWGVVYNIPRTASAYCIEDTHVFYLEKEYFDKVLAAKFFKSDMKKINFILDKFPVLKNNYGFRHLVTKITPCYFDKDSLVYTNYDQADFMYLVFQGECALMKLPNSKSKEDCQYKKDRMIRLTTLDVGAIAGLECCNAPCNYENCLMATQNFTVLLKVKFSFMDQAIKGFKEDISQLYKEQSKINDRAEKRTVTENEFIIKEKDNNNIIENAINPFKKDAEIIKFKIKSASYKKGGPVKNSLKQKKLVLNNNKILLLPRMTNNEEVSSTTTQAKRTPLKLVTNKKKEISFLTYKNASALVKKRGSVCSVKSSLSKNSRSIATITSEKSALTTLTQNHKKKTLLSLNEDISPHAHGSPYTHTYTEPFRLTPKPSPSPNKKKNLKRSQDIGIDRDILLNTKYNIKSNSTITYYNSGNYDLPFITEM